MVDALLEVLEMIQKNTIRKYTQIDHYCAVSASTVGNYARILGTIKCEEVNSIS